MYFKWKLKDFVKNYKKLEVKLFHMTVNDKNTFISEKNNEQILIQPHSLQIYIDELANKHSLQNLRAFVR